jgi:N4-(beta-N-acetylglucosaminyl)-L-asparaginase
VALAVATATDHHLLVGHGAQEFARQMGFTIEADLNTPNSRAQWLEWQRRIDPGHWLDPNRKTEAAARATASMVAAGLVDADKIWGTIHCHAVGPQRDVAGVTTTSGLAWKIPGRVGDSPILGAGNWVDASVGAAGSTGRGEANLYNLSSHLIVELMRNGQHPKDAGLEALRRIRANTTTRVSGMATGATLQRQVLRLEPGGRLCGCGALRRSAGDHRRLRCEWRTARTARRPVAVVEVAGPAGA